LKFSPGWPAWAGPPELYPRVEPTACIGCGGCAELYPQVFMMVGRVAVATRGCGEGLYQDVLRACPSRAIGL